LPFSVLCENDLFHQFVKICENVNDDDEPEHGKVTARKTGVREAGDMLCRFIDEYRVLDSENGPRRPLVVLAFDEAHTLTDNPPTQIHWNLFSELCRVLQQINHLQIFSLFLSTAGRFDKFIFSPDLHHDPSARPKFGQPDFRPLDPISEISFDDIAHLALKNTVNIYRVVETDWIAHLGRPLYVHPNYPFRELLSYYLD
jgi:hypothetical protein